eukprot:TRINITY_DN3963_c0_g2_i1.p1 TRINITY_DN3963_c0_g2~~TRINITY_DN3963_c0_g2_i1.p1  ORF type:complete len:811 (+),score=196.61 TRINITY_DN3963_c0_g2_i1:314-2434(+)
MKKDGIDPSLYVGKRKSGVANPPSPAAEKHLSAPSSSGSERRRSSGAKPDDSKSPPLLSPASETSRPQMPSLFSASSGSAGGLGDAKDGASGGGPPKLGRMTSKAVPGLLMKLQSTRTQSLEFATLRMLSAYGKSAFDEKNGEPLVKEHGYLGPHLIYPLTLENVIAMIEHFRKLDDMVAPESRSPLSKISSTIHRVPLHKDYVIDLLRRTSSILEELPNVVHVPLPKGEDASIHVVGDIHGQLEDLLHILEVKGYPSEKAIFIFNGDFVDRGHWGVEVVCILFALKLLYPNFVHLNRGNHESRAINLRDGFEKEVMSKYDAETFNCFSQAFSTLPIACVIQKKIFVVHGGLAWDNFTLAELDEESRFLENPNDETLLCDLLWSDPSKNKGRVQNDRGCGIKFGPDIVQNFLEKNGLTCIVRSHQCVKKGVVRHFNGKLYTVFSASNYCGKANNQGAVLTFHTPNFPAPAAHQYFAVQKELMGRFNEAVPGVPIVAQDVVCRLVERIMGLRNELEAFWVSLVQSTPRKGTTPPTLLHVDEWSLGLSTVLKLSVPWEKLAKYFPGYATAFIEEDKVDYVVFLEANNPLHCVLKRFPSDVPKFDRKVEDTMSRLMDIIHKNRNDLKDTFRWMDSDQSGEISFEEFRSGLVSLHLISGEDIETASIVRQLFERIDVNKDGTIVYEEFFEAFQTTSNVSSAMAADELEAN